MAKRIILFLFSLLLVSQFAIAETFVVDPVHSQVEFSVVHLMFFKVRGGFDDYQATLQVDPEARTLSEISATINTATIDTREKKRDDHLRSPDFFDVVKFPEMKFVSRNITGSADNIMVTGNLTIRGITQQVVLTGSFAGVNTDPWGNLRAGFSASTKISRENFGLTWNKTLETGGVLVGDEVEINLDIQAIKK